MTSARTYAILQARASGAPAPAKQKKIPARKVVYDGYVFDSGIEFRRYQELRLLEKTGHIQGLCVHTPFDFVVNGNKIGTYTDDFDYYERAPGSHVWEWIVEGTFTRKLREYRRNCKLMQACHGITIREIVK